MRGRLISLFLLAGIVVPASNALAESPNTTRGSIGIRLVAAPGGSRSDPLARLYVIAHVAPSTSIHRRVEFSNSTRSPVDIAVYVAAAGVRRGTFWFAPGRSQNELSTWTSLNRRMLRLPAESKAFETVTVTIPKDASAGERQAVIWAEAAAPTPAKGGVRLVNRVGVRMYVSIGPGGAPAPNFSIGPLSPRRSPSGRPLVVARVRNTGGRTLDISGTLTLSKGPGGLGTGPFPVKLRALLAPNASERVTVRLDRRLPRGSWRARMQLRSGLIHRMAVATIKFPRRAVTSTPRTSTKHPGGSRRVIFTAILPLALVALALLLSARILRKRRSFGRAAPIRSA